MADVIVIKNNFPDIANKLPTVLSQIVRKSALDVQAAASSTAPIDIGFLRNSIYVETSSDSTYGSVGAPIAKQGKHGPDKVDAYVLPEVAAPDDDQTAIVAVGANYGLYVELGTRHAPSQPYLAPAVEQVRGSFEDALGQIESQLA